MIKKLFFLISVVIFSAAGSPPDSAIDFAVHDLEGATHSLEEYRGKVLVIDFWAMWCTTCYKLFPILNKLHADYPEDSLVVLGISLDSKPSQIVAKFAKKNDLDYRIFHDPKGVLPKKIGITALPTTMVLDAQGTLIHKKTGFEKGDGTTLVNTVKNLMQKSSSQDSARTRSGE